MCLLPRIFATVTEARPAMCRHCRSTVPAFAPIFAMENVAGSGQFAPCCVSCGLEELGRRAEQARASFGVGTG